MTSCTRTNDTALQCEHGCCGDNANQKCCSFELSETIIIVSCVVGALIVFSTVIMLVHCITKKKKDAVRPIRHRRRQPRDREAVRRRRQMMEMPPPPPYTEAPPEYNSWNQTNRATPTFPARSDTEHEHAAPSRSSQTRTTRNPPQPEGRTLSTISNTRVHTQSDIPIIVASRASHVVDTPQFNEHDKNRSVSRHVSSPTEEGEK